MLLIQHNSFLNISDHLSPLIRNEFRGSQATENFSCGRTKQRFGRERDENCADLFLRPIAFSIESGCL